MTDFQVDALNYGFYVGGQFLFMLKRAGSAVRSPIVVYKNKWQFFKGNWDTILIRAIFEFPFFYAWRHYSLAQIVSFTGWVMPTGWALPDNPFTALVLGYAADSLLDWFAMWKRLPAWLRKWLNENVPHLPAVELRLVPKDDAPTPPGDVKKE